MRQPALSKVVGSFALVGLLLAPAAMAGELTWRPMSPGLGGDPQNTTYLLQSATIQNLTRPRHTQTTQTAQQQFVDGLRSRIYSRLSAQLTDAIFGENAKEAGKIDLGGETVGYERIGNNIVLTLTENGKATTITVPVSSVAP